MKTEKKDFLLSNRYPGVRYLRILPGRSDGGSQEWWRERTERRGELNYRDFSRDADYRLWRMGCGVVAMADLELYLTQQRDAEGPQALSGGTEGEAALRGTGSGGTAEEAALRGTGSGGTAEEAALRGTGSGGIEGEAPPYDAESGAISREDYMAYLQRSARAVYRLGGGALQYVTGLFPWTMKRGLAAFLRRNHISRGSVRWAPHALRGRSERKRLVLRDIEEMLEEDLPVVLAYHSFRRNGRLLLYPTLSAAEKRDENAPGRSSVLSHYMTAIGLYRGTDGSPILEVVSWGRIYYIRYDEYSRRLSFFSNILRIC